VFTAEEHAFAARLQEPLQQEFGTMFETSLHQDVQPLSESQENSRGSTDVGDISWHVPTGGLRTTCAAADSPGHSWQNVACIGSSIGDKGTVYAAKVIAATAVQLLEDPDLCAAARSEWESRMKDRKYTSLIPEGQPAPSAIR
jgi:aminobenzoyl-glutamate utilization protein B